jgi:SAM-dependent methyltransferase
LFKSTHWSYRAIFHTYRIHAHRVFAEQVVPLYQDDWSDQMHKKMVWLLRRLRLLKPAYRTYEWSSTLHPRTLQRNYFYRRQSRQTGIRIPPDLFIVKVIGFPNVSLFIESGQTIAQMIKTVLAQHGILIDSLPSMLEFGCGCGRIMRHWNSLDNVQIYGTDYNTKMIKWCQKNLSFAHFTTNELAPPLSFEAHKFDFVYAYSVFTHLSEELQRDWMSELSRVLKPRGYLLLTVSGQSFLNDLSDVEKKTFLSGHLVVRYPQISGTNHCAVFHPESYVRSELAKDFDILDYIYADTYSFVRQDLILLQAR